MKSKTWILNTDSPPRWNPFPLAWAGAEDLFTAALSGARRRGVRLAAELLGLAALVLLAVWK